MMIYKCTIKVLNRKRTGPHLCHTVKKLNMFRFDNQPPPVRVSGSVTQGVSMGKCKVIHAINSVFCGISSSYILVLLQINTKNKLRKSNAQIF